MCCTSKPFRSNNFPKTHFSFSSLHRERYKFWQFAFLYSTLYFSISKEGSYCIVCRSSSPSYISITTYKLIETSTVRVRQKSESADYHRTGIKNFFTYMFITRKAKHRLTEARRWLNTSRLQLMILFQLTNKRTSTKNIRHSVCIISYPAHC